MAQEISYQNDATGSDERARGSDNRLNVSSRSDSRSYYNSRDNSAAFSLSWDDTSSAAGDFILYWKNTDATGKKLILHKGVLNSVNNCSFKIWTVTGTAAGATATPVCLNFSAPQSANATCIEAAGTAITGITADLLIGHEAAAAYSPAEFDDDDTVIVGQDQAIAIEYEQGTTGRTWGTLYGFYE